jgi:hypothetical protein
MFIRGLIHAALDDLQSLREQFSLLARASFALVRWFRAFFLQRASWLAAAVVALAARRLDPGQRFKWVLWMLFHSCLWPRLGLSEVNLTNLALDECLFDSWLFSSNAALLYGVFKKALVDKALPLLLQRLHFCLVGCYFQCIWYRCLLIRSMNWPLACHARGLSLLESAHFNSGLEPYLLWEWILCLFLFFLLHHTHVDNHSLQLRNLRL